MTKFGYLLLKILSIVNSCYAIEKFMQDARVVDASKLNDIIPDLYNLYLEVVKKDEKKLTRRLFRDNTPYKVHIERLRDVNGVKTHNLLVTDDYYDDSIEPLIYINNPVESHIPFSYLNKEQFKNAVLKSVKKRKDEFKNEYTKKHSTTVKHLKVFKRTTELLKKQKKTTGHKIATKKVAAIRKKIKIRTTTIPTFPEIFTTTTDPITTTTLQIETEITSTNVDSTTITYKSTTVSKETENPEVESTSVSFETEVSEEDSTTISMKTEVPEVESVIESMETEVPQVESTTLSVATDAPELEITTVSTETKVPELESTTTSVETEEEIKVTKVRKTKRKRSKERNAKRKRLKLRSTESESSTTTERTTRRKKTAKTRGRPFVFLGKKKK